MDSQKILYFAEIVRERNKKLIATVHGDCHESTEMATLMKNSDVWIRIASADYRHCRVTKVHQKGKEERTFYDLGIENNQLVKVEFSNINSKAEEKVGPNPGSETSAQSQPISSFNLSLSDKEKEDREKVEMPFWKKSGDDAVGGSGGKIEYVPDDNDDWDEEDPDDDLDF